MNDHPNATSTRALLDAFGRGDLAAVGTHFAADAVWELPGHSTIAGTFHGPDEIVGFLARSYELSGGSLRVEPIEVLGTDWGAVQVQRVRGQHQGRQLDCVELLAHRIVDGKIVHTYHRPDQYAVDGFFG